MNLRLQTHGYSSYELIQDETVTLAIAPYDASGNRLVVGHKGLGYEFSNPAVVGESTSWFLWSNDLHVHAEGPGEATVRVRSGAASTLVNFRVK